MKGVIRVKTHLMANKCNAAACTKTREELWKLFKEKTATSSINAIHSAAYGNNESEDDVEISTASNDKGRKSGGNKGPLNMFFCRNPTTAKYKRKKVKLRQDYLI